MSCFGGRVSQDLYQNCCNANVLCEFDGDMSRVVSEPIYVQKVYDAVLVHLQGMKTDSESKLCAGAPMWTSCQKSHRYQMQTEL